MNSETQLTRYWEARRLRIERELAGLHIDEEARTLWNAEVFALRRDLQAFLVRTASQSWWAHFWKFLWMPGGIRASRELIRHFIAGAKIEALFSRPELDRSAVYRVPARRFYPADVVTLPPDQSRPEARPGKPLLRVSFLEHDPLFFVGGEINPLTGTAWSRGYTLWFDDTHKRRFHSDELIGAACARRFPKIAPRLKSTEALLDRVLQHGNDTGRRDSLMQALASLDEKRSQWQRVHLPEHQILELLTNAELFEANDPAAPRGLLLSGVPGTGKTLLARTLAQTTGCSFHSATIADLKSGHIGGTGGNVRALWDKARASEPAILFVDECEGIFARRGGVETDAFTQDLVQTFLAEWDGVRGPSQVWVIGATNRRDLLDDAILSRFGLEMEIGLPNADARGRILKQELAGVGFRDEIPPGVVDGTQGLSGRDLAQLARKIRALAHPRVPTAADFTAALGSLRQRGSTRVEEDSTWENLILDDSTKSTLQLTCDLLRNAEAWAARGVAVPRGILLDGPPGVGKTQIARTLAHEGGLAFLSATTADVKGRYLGHSGAQVKQLFERARGSAPAILFLDELDVLAPRRDRGSSDAFADEIVGQLLQELDGLKAQTGTVFILAATNHPASVDSAVLSRFPRRISLPLPDESARGRLIAVLLRGKTLDFTVEEGAGILAKRSAAKQWSGRDLRSWVENAEQQALMRAVANGGPDTFRITLADFVTD